MGAARARTMAVMAATLVALLAGCDSDGSTPTTTTPTGGGAAPSNAASTPTAPAVVALPTGGQCVLITKEQATSLLGSSPKSTSGNTTGEEFVKIDGCAYTGTANSLGYDINDVSTAGDPKTLVQAGMAAVARAPGAKKFDVPGGDAAIGFTMPVGPKTMARIEVAKGKYLIAVLATSADPATAKQVALAAAQTLVAAVS